MSQQPPCSPRHQSPFQPGPQNPVALWFLDTGLLPSPVPPFVAPRPRRLNRSFSAPQCSASCGKGTRMRYVSCRDNQGGVAEESACAHLPKPPAREVCSVVACGQWKVLEWTAVRKPPGAPSSSALSIKAAFDYLEFYPSLSKWCELSDRRKKCRKDRFARFQTDLRLITPRDSAVGSSKLCVVSVAFQMCFFLQSLFVSVHSGA